MKKLNKQYMVIGLGRFGTSLAKYLVDLGGEVLAIDTDETVVNAIAPYVTHAVVADATDEEVLRSLEPESFQTAIVSIGENTRDSILVSLLCKELGVPVVVTKANDDLHAKVLKKIGVDKVIFPERDMGIRLAKSLISGNFIDMLTVSSDYQIAEFLLPEEWRGTSLATLNVRQKYHISIIAIKRGEDFIAAPTADMVLVADDILFAIGKNEDINRITML